MMDMMMLMITGKRSMNKRKKTWQGVKNLDLIWGRNKYLQ